MFKQYEFSLIEPLEEKEIPLFTYKFLQQVDVVKIHVDPIDKKSGQVLFLNDKDSSQIIKKINKFLYNWENKRNGKENKKNNFFKNYTIDVKDPDLQNLCTCHNPINKENVTNILLEEKWLNLLKGKDVGYSREINRLLDLFDKKFMELFAEEFSEWDEKFYSPLINSEYLEKMGYFNTSANHIFFAAHLNPDVEKENQFYDLTKNNEGKLSEETNQYINTPNYVLQTAPCFKVYFSLEDQLITNNMVYSIKGNCYRNEGKKTFLLERLNHFTMREFVFFGTQDFIMKNRDKSLELTVKLMDYFGLKCKSELANDPFFLSDDVNQEKNFKIPNKVKYEVRADIPYKKDSISIASFDTHGNYFSEIFNFKFDNGETVWTGCIGLGLERCVWSFLQQFGLNTEGWPEDIRREICSLSKVPQLKEI